MTNEFCEYGELVRSRKAFFEFAQYDFDPDVALKIARLVRWANVQYADYDKVRGQLEHMHSKRAADGSMLRMQAPARENGETVMKDIPGTFQVKDPDAWARDDGTLSAGRLRFPVEDRITSEDVSKIRGIDGKVPGPANPGIIAGLGPFFAWPTEDAEHHSVADDIWKAIEASDVPPEPSEDAVAA